MNDHADPPSLPCLENSNRKRLNELLVQWRNGGTEAYNELVTLLYEDLVRISRKQILGERNNHTLQTHDLLNKLYIKLLGSKTIPWTDYVHFLRTAARTMRQILIDHARVWGRRADGGHGMQVDKTHGGLESEAGMLKLLALDEAMTKLHEMDPLAAQIAELKIFLGLSVYEIARELELSVNKAKREWQFVKRFIGHKLIESQE